MLKDVEVGDRVFSARFVWGEVIDVDVNCEWPIYAIFDGGEYHSYTLNGMEFCTDKYPTCWSEDKIPAWVQDK